MSISFTCIKILVQTYGNMLKTNGYIIKKLIYLVVQITQQILTIRRIRTTLSENWDCPVFFAEMRSKLSDKICFVGQLEPHCWTIGTTFRKLEPPPLEGQSKVGAWQNVPFPKLSYIRDPSTN